MNWLQKFRNTNRENTKSDDIALLGAHHLKGKSTLQTKSSTLLPSLSPERLRRFQHTRFIAWCVISTLCLLFTVLAFMQESLRFAQTTTERIIICIDLSHSMLAVDARYTSSPTAESRLNQAKNIIVSLLATRPSAEFALVVFAGESALLSPFTAHISSLFDIVHVIEPGYLDTRGSTLLPLARILSDRFPAIAYRDCPISAVILSDGDMPAQDKEYAIPMFDALHYPLHTIVVGSDVATTVILDDSTRLTTKRQQDALKTIAQHSLGSFHCADQYTSSNEVCSALLQGTSTRNSSWILATQQMLNDWYASILQAPLYAICGLIILGLLFDIVYTIFFRLLVIHHTPSSTIQKHTHHTTVIQSVLIGIFLLYGEDNTLYAQSSALKQDILAVHYHELAPAIKLMQVQNYGQAIEHLSVLLEHSTPSSSLQRTTLYMRSIAFCAQGNFQRGFDDATTALTDSPHSSLVYSLLPIVAECAYKTQRYPQAILACQQGLQINPNDQRLKRILSLCYQQHQQSQSKRKEQQQQSVSARTLEAEGRSALRTMLRKQSRTYPQGID